MNKWVKRKWLKALRSGEYRKGRYTLKADSTYCCLGVLVEEMAPEFARHRYGGMIVGTEYNNASMLPDDLAIMWGLSDIEQNVLARKNDYSQADDFRDVIAYIEENL